MISPCCVLTFGFESFDSFLEGNFCASSAFLVFMEPPIESRYLKTKKAPTRHSRFSLRVSWKITAIRSFQKINNLELDCFQVLRNLTERDEISAATAPPPDTAATLQIHIPEILIIRRPMQFDRRPVIS